MDNKELDKLEALAKAAEQMFTGMHWYTRFQILDGISNDESAAFIGALDPDTVLGLIELARVALAAPTAAVEPSEQEAKDAARYRYLATLQDWKDIEAMCWSSTASSAAEFRRDLDRYIDAAMSAAQAQPKDTTKGQA